MDEKLLGHQFPDMHQNKPHFYIPEIRKKPQKSLFILLIFVNYIISAFQNVILHQIWSINKESMAILILILFFETDLIIRVAKYIQGAQFA